MSIQQLIDIVTEAYPKTEVLIRTNIQGTIHISNPPRETVEMPAKYFANVFERDELFPPDHPKHHKAHRAYAPTIERALVLAISLRDPHLLFSRGYAHKPAGVE